jgi:uncharacterized protein YegL
LSDKTLISILVDRSGSMQSISRETEGGIRSFLADQAKLPGKVKVRLSQFDTTYDVVYETTKIKDVPEFQLEPRGLTALVDSVAKTILDTDKTADKFDKVIVLILTDGGENASKEWSAEHTKKLVEARKQDGWEFIFLGANIDAVQTGAQFGIDKGSSLTYGANTRGVGNTFAAASAYTTSTRSGLVAEFTEEERNQAMGE